MAQVDEDLLEADAENRLYQLLGERTRQEHMALDQKVRHLPALLTTAACCRRAGWVSFGPGMALLDTSTVCGRWAALLR